MTLTSVWTGPGATESARLRHIFPPPSILLFSNLSLPPPLTLLFQCWETRVGARLYTLTWTNIAFTIFSTYFGDIGRYLVRRSPNKIVAFMRSQSGPPVFQQVRRGRRAALYPHRPAFVSLPAKPTLSFRPLPRPSSLSGQKRHGSALHAGAGLLFNLLRALRHAHRHSDDHAAARRKIDQPAPVSAALWR